MRPPIDLSALSWRQVASYLESDCRIVIPLGATEEHGDLSLLTDTLFVDRVTHAACQDTGVLRAPAMPFGCSAFAVNFPGSISLRTATMVGLVTDVVDCLHRQGFSRLVFVTGHGGNEVITGALAEAMLDRPNLAVYYHNAWLPMMEELRRVEAELGLPPTGHAAWHEAFDFARVGPIHVEDATIGHHPDFPEFPLNPRLARKHLESGVVSGRSYLADDDLLERLLGLSADSLRQILADLAPKAPNE